MIKKESFAVYLGLADAFATRSNDPSSKFGAVIVDQDTGSVISHGWNGFPPGITEDDRMHNRAIKYEYVVHAETRAIINAHRDLTGTIMFVNGLPCCRCAVNIIEAGIHTVVTSTPTADYLSRWAESVERTRNLFKEAGVRLIEL